MNSDFASRIRKLRKGKHLTQEFVADMIGVNKSTISAYENGKREPSNEILIKLSDIYHVSTDYLLGKTSERRIDVYGIDDEVFGALGTIVEAIRKSRKL